MKIFLLLLISAVLYAEIKEVPVWVLSGILKVETRSYYKEDGTIKYIDKRRGLHGELGCFQMTRIAFDQIRYKNEQFWMIEQDKALAEDCAIRYLLWLHNNYAKGNWNRTIEMYNSGPKGRSRQYLALVRKYGLSKEV